MKLRRKLLWLLITTALAGAACVGVGAGWVLRGAVRANYVERIRAETAALAEWARDLLAVEAQGFAVTVSRRLGARVTLVAADGVVLGDSARDPEGVRRMDNHLARPEIQAALSRGSGESLRQSGTTNVEYFYAAHRVEGDGPVGFVRIALPASRVSEAQARFGWLITGVVLTAMFFLTVVAYFAVRSLSKPVEEMSLAADRIAAGDLGLEVPQHRRDEVGRLGAAVNRMKRSLLDKIEELEDEHALRASVISDMREGLLVVGADGRVTLANEAAREILDVAFDPTDRLLAEVVRHPSVVDVVERALKGGEPSQEAVLQLPGSGRSFEVRATPLERGGVILLFFDVTRMEALENVRREFVANVSHELRTPLTSIKAFIETLLTGDEEDRVKIAEFLRIIEKHANRMDALIDDITDLSRIETGAVSLELQSLDVARIASDVAHNLHLHQEQYDVEVRVGIESPFPIHADQRRFEQVMTNLIDNGIKFNRPGGKVHVRGVAEKGRRLVIVEDTGIGIPADSLERVFNRFYRVDAARSRAAGGTGLGLAIVKHLMRLHGGRVHVESELGKGSRFVLEFPCT